ncbi:hypothetical protein RF11_07960 [Thelohanellus kitauei]|uniref:Uncharacterized protein n=1 Tax=Thelohanellus kitauei TaxID=669202 RepID=A0A0C2NCN8_THEKT|nr:hypothetical protein RF11_07960 [Thelohanellus kitauei]
MNFLKILDQVEYITISQEGYMGPGMCHETVDSKSTFFIHDINFGIKIENVHHRFPQNFGNYFTDTDPQGLEFPSKYMIEHSTAGFLNPVPASIPLKAMLVITKT